MAMWGIITVGKSLMLVLREESQVVGRHQNRHRRHKSQRCYHNENYAKERGKILISPLKKEKKMRVKNNIWMGLIIGYFVMSLFSGLAYAQKTTGQEKWVYIYDNPTIDRNDQFNDIRCSPYDGYIYATGTRFRDESHTQIYTTKLDPATGDTIWSRIFDPTGNTMRGEGYEIAFDNAGNIYVAGAHYAYGSRMYDFTIIKYLPDGTQAHENRYDVRLHEDMALSVDVGPDNAVYVAGYTTDADLEHEYVVRKYDTSLTYTGNMLVHNYDGYDNECRRVRVDNDLNVWSCGTAKISGDNLDFIVEKSDTSLNQLGIYEKSGIGPLSEVALDLCLPWIGTGVYACGYLSSYSIDKKFVATRLDNDCNEVWFWEYSNPFNGNDRAQRIVSGPSNAVYVAGYTQGSSSVDYTVACIVPFGPNWVWTYNGSMDQDDQALDIGIDTAGTYVYACGYSKNMDQDYDFVVTKHSLNDTTRWIYEYNGPGGQTDMARSIDVATDGNLYLAGNIELVPGLYYEAGAMCLPQNFPPTIPVQILPVRDAILSDTVGVTWLWNASTDFETPIAKYILYYTNNSQFQKAESLVTTDTTVSTTLKDTKCYWKIKAQDTGGAQSKFSDVWAFNFDLTAPDIPVLISPIEDVFVLNTSVTFDWGVVALREIPSPVRYVIQIDTDDTFPAPIVDDTCDVDSITLNLPGDNRYYWRVKAYDLAGNDTSYSDVESFKLDMSPPLIESTTVWSDTSFAGPFAVYSKVTDLFGVDSVILMYSKPMEHPSWFPREMLEGSDGIYFEEIPSATMANDTVKYYIYAKDNAGRVSTDYPGAPTDYYWFIAGYDPGVTEFNNPTVFSFGLKNNPAKDKALFNISLPNEATISLCIYDVSGRLVANLISGRNPAGHYEIPWDPKTASGIYFYKLESPWKNEVGKLVLVR
jgi:hypothetical protein